MSANGRPHEPMLDGFHMSLEDLGKIADKFQQRFSLLLAMVQVPGVVQSLSPYQRPVTFKSNRARGASSVIISLPVKSTVTDADFVYIVLRRLLRSNLGSLSPNTRCPVGFCRSSIDADHLESCTGSRIKSNRSDALNEGRCY